MLTFRKVIIMSPAGHKVNDVQAVEEADHRIANSLTLLGGLVRFQARAIGKSGKTFSAAESRVVLGVPDAFTLPSLPGSGYLKTVGADQGNHPHSDQATIEERFSLGKDALAPTFIYRPARGLYGQIGGSLERNDAYIFNSPTVEAYLRELGKTNPAAQADQSRLLRVPTGVTYVVAERGAGQAQGFDLGSEPERAALLNQLEHQLIGPPRERVELPHRRHPAGQVSAR